MKPGSIYRNARGKINQLFRLILDWFKQNRLVSGLIAVVMGVEAQLLLSADKFLVSAIIGGLALLLFVINFAGKPGPETKLTVGPPAKQSFNSRWSRWASLTLGLAILLAGLAFWSFGTSIPAIYPWLLHLSSIGLLILSGLWMNKAGAAAGTPVKKQIYQGRWTWVEIGIFLAILAIAAFMRLYRFDQIPFGLWFDEADNGLNALKILNQAGYLPVFVKSTNLPAHFLYLIAFAFRILGVSTLTIRSVSVVFGLATVAAAFFLGQELFNRKLGLALAFFLAISRWDVNWSRIGMHGVTVPFFEILSAGLVLSALRKQRPLDYCLAGLSLGIGLCFYTPLDFFPAVIGVFLLFLWSRRHDLIRSSWRGVLLLVLGIFIVSVPVTQYALRQPETFSDRINVTSIFNGKTPQEGWEAVVQTTRAHLLMFNYHGDNNGRHNLPGEPMLDPISGALLFLGLGLSLARMRQPGSFLLTAWLLMMILPGIFSIALEAPQSLRAIGSLPAAYLLAAVPIHALWQEWDHLPANRPAAIFILPLILVLGGVGAINYHIYFDLQSKNYYSWSVFSTPETIIGKTMADMSPQIDKYVSVFYVNTPTLQFLAPKVTDYHTLQTYDSLPIPSDGKKAMVFFVDPNRRPFFLQAQHYYPNADFKEYKSPDGMTALYQITLQPTDIAAAQGITVSYYQNANWSDPPYLVRKEASITADWPADEPTQPLLGVLWRGVLYAQQDGLYHLTLHSPTPSALFLDNAPIPLTGEGVQTADVELAKGSHELILRTLAKSGHFELDWQPPNAEQGPIPASDLFVPPISNNGLLGKYYPNGDWQGPPALTKVDPWIAFYFQNLPLDRPYSVEWTGRINIPKEGHYLFSLSSRDESELFIDEVNIVGTTEANRDMEAGVDLTAGLHSIRLRYADRTSYTYIYLNWTPPNSKKESIPEEVLFLP